MTSFHRPQPGARSLGVAGLAMAFGLLASGCNRQEPTTARGLSETSARARESQQTNAPGSSRPAQIAASPSTPVEATAAATLVRDAGAHAESTEPSLFGEDGGALPQTEERPTQSERFEARMALLLQAIREDDPTRARAVFFPIVAYRQVKAIANPDRDYERRLLRAFERDIHDYHRKLAGASGDSRLASVDVPEAHARWMKPGSEGNKLGYWRVLRSALHVVDASGKQRTLGITSLISWRGEWYVVHLNGFE
jgi:hypothetical protein